MQSFELVRDENQTTHAYRRVLTLCGEWVDAGRWSALEGAVVGRSSKVTCGSCLVVLEREDRIATPT